MSCTPSRTMLPIAVACVGDIPFAVQRPRARWSNHWQHLVACSWQRQHRTGPFLPVSLRWHETSALMHRGVRATLVREWRMPANCPPGSLCKINGGLPVEFLLGFGGIQRNGVQLIATVPAHARQRRPSRTADIRLRTSVTVVCRPVPMLYPGRFDGRATSAHEGPRWQ
jgi:hypothetical protein